MAIKPIKQQIECQNLRYQIQSKALLKNVSCQFSAGQISVILGKNGAGKSTLLSLLSKELVPNSGNIIWQEKSLAQLNYADLARQRAVLPQLQTPAFSLTVQALITLGAQVQQELSSQQIKHIVQTVMDACDVSYLAEQDVIKLSGGEQQRAQLARVLAQIWPVHYDDTELQKPFLGRWLLLDEWTNNLDLHHQQSLAQYFKQWASKGLGIIMVLHDINLCAQVADKVVLLNQATLFTQGNVIDVLNTQTIQQALGLTVKIAYIEGIQHPVILPTTNAG